MNSEYLVLDIENDNSNSYGCDAGCYLIDPIVALGFKNKNELYSTYIYPQKLDRLEIDEDLIVGHNLAHDLLFLWHLDDLQNFFKGGGQVWDTQLAEYIISGHEIKYASLRDIAVNTYGCPKREKHMEKYWKDGKQTSEIPKDIVKVDVENDVLDTETVYLQQRERAEKLGMLSLIKLQMDARLATIEIKYNGMKIQKETLLENKKKLEKELENFYLELKKISERYWK